MSLSSSNRKYAPFPLFSYFSVVVCLRCLLHHILSLIIYTFRENREFVFIQINLWWVQIVGYVFGMQIVFVCFYITPSHYHHCANFILRHWTYKMPVRYNLSSVWVRLSIFSQLFIIQYVRLCVLACPFPSRWLREYTYFVLLSSSNWKFVVDSGIVWGSNILKWERWVSWHQSITLPQFDVGFHDDSHFACG